MGLASRTSMLEYLVDRKPESDNLHGNETRYKPISGNNNHSA